MLNRTQSANRMSASHEEIEPWIEESKAPSWPIRSIDWQSDVPSVIFLHSKLLKDISVVLHSQYLQ